MCQKDTMLSPKVGVIILNWNGADNTIECLASLADSSYTNLEIIVLDNGSVDDSVPRLRATFPEVTLLCSPTNIGCAAGNNWGTRAALARGCQYVLLLNSDTVVEPDMVAKMVAAYPTVLDIGFLGVKECRYDDRHILHGIGICWSPVTCKAYSPCEGRNERECAHSQPVQVEAVSACAMMFSAEVPRKIGLIDEFFFAYYEELDWCLRARDAGLRNYCLTNTRVFHKGSRSTRDNSPRGKKAAYLIYRGWGLIARKHGQGPYRWFAFLQALRKVSQSLLWGALTRDREYRDYARAKLAGFRDGWLHRPCDTRRLSS